MINILIGLVAGMFGGLVGLGGGVIMIPLMVGVLKLTQHQAHGTSLVALVFTGIAGAITYAMKGSVDIVASELLAVTAIFTARFGAHAHWKLGNVVTKILAGLIPGIFIGTYFGSSLALVLPEAVLRVIFAAVLI